MTGTKVYQTLEEVILTTTTMTTVVIRSRGNSLFEGYAYNVMRDAANLLERDVVSITVGSGGKLLINL